MKNKIYNTKIDVKGGIELNEKDYAMSLLKTLEEMEKLYVLALIEASNEELYEEYYDAFIDMSNLQRKVYEVMFRHGWYQLEISLENKIEDKYNELNERMNDLE